MSGTATAAHACSEVTRARSRPEVSRWREVSVVRAALGLLAVHVVDDNYVQPAAGSSAGDHVVSGLVPVLVLAVVAAFYPYLRAGLRAATAMSLGTIGIAMGTSVAYAVWAGSATGESATGLLALVAGLVLLVSGPVTLWKARRTTGSWARRHLRRSLNVVVGLLFGGVAFWVVVFPVGFSYVYTHTGRAETTPDLGVAIESVTVTTADSLDLRAWYLPSRNRAAVVVFPGATRVDEARMLARHGYGVLLLEPRGQGGSEGDVVRWAGDRDLLAGASYLQGRSDVDADRIGGLGFSIGGENLLEAAAASPAFKAVVSEGAGERVGEADASGLSRLVSLPTMAVMTAATTVFSNHGPSPPIVERIGRIAPRPVFLIYAEPGMGGEAVRQPKYFAAAAMPKQIWKVPGASHTGGIDAQPAEYERRVIDFYDRSLLGAN